MKTIINKKDVYGKGHVEIDSWNKTSYVTIWSFSKKGLISNRIDLSKDDVLKILKTLI